MSTENNAIVNTETVINTPVENPVENPLPQEDDTQEDQTDIQIHNLEKKIINLCGKIYNLKQTKENKQKVIDQSTYPDYIKLYEKHANFSKQYLKNINCVLKLDMIKTKENLYACITNEEYGIYKLLFALSKIDTISTRKSYLCAIKHLIVNIIPDSTNNCSIISHEIKDLIYRNNRITRNKKNSQIKASSI